MNKIKLLVLQTLVGLSVSACPLIDTFYIDYNCNGNLKIAIAGDSIVEGVGDFRNNDRGGYVKRLRDSVGTGHKFINFGIPGITSGRLLREFMRNINKPLTAKKLRNVDMVWIDVGRNDYWTPTSSSLLVARNIKRLVKFLKRKLRKAENGGSPYFVIATLLPTQRGFQQPFIDAVNSHLRRMNSKNFPVKLFFHKVPATVISIDGLHPDSKGYDRIGKFATRFFENKLQTILAKKRPDADSDGAFDVFEDFFSTDKNNPDTDGDTFLDGAEIYELETDPLDPSDPAPSPSPLFQ